MAFGNGAPDVFSAIAAITNSKNGDAGLAFGALFGAGVFVSTVIVGIICFIKPFYSVQRPLLRDMIFFMIAGFWLFVVVWDGKIALWETLGSPKYFIKIIIVKNNSFVVLKKFFSNRFLEKKYWFNQKTEEKFFLKINLFFLFNFSFMSYFLKKNFLFTKAIFYT